MRVAGRASWLIGVDQWNQPLEWALWFRAAERIEVRADGPVTGPPDVDPLPTPSLTESDELAEGWLWWWRTLLVRPSLAAPPTPLDLADLNRFGPPDFEGLAGHPALQRVVTARWGEANAWHSARKQAGIATFRQMAGGPPGAGREGEVVRAVEAEIGHTAAAFSLRIVVLPVLDEQIRSAGEHTFLVPERVHAASAYDDWLRTVVRALA
ncbi:MAG TPA: hypothetical protein VGD84_24845 [Pseudonocardiaceae bacterium]